MLQNLVYTRQMRRILTLVLLLATLALVAAPFASADPCNGNGSDGSQNPHCQNAPEASSVLLFPLAAVAVVGGYVLLTRRRRPADL
jgi:hypothetical protein